MGRYHPLAVTGLEHPTALGLVEDGRMHPCIKLDIAAHVEAVGDVVDVPQDLRLRRIALGPNPLLLQLL
jgi:hypothetical protein